MLKMVLSLYLSWKSSELNEIWYADADCASKVGYLTINVKNCNLSTTYNGKMTHRKQQT